MQPGANQPGMLGPPAGRTAQLDALAAAFDAAEQAFTAAQGRGEVLRAGAQDLAGAQVGLAERGLAQDRHEEIGAAQVRLNTNTAAFPTKPKGMQNRLGVLGGDVAGFA